MRILGVSALGHDAAVSVLSDGQITFAAHAERYSRIKNDPHLNADLLADALRDGPPDVICWFERPWRKKLRQIVAGQWQEVLTPRPRTHLAQFGLDRIPIRYYDQHYTHAAAGYFTSPFREACVIVVDAIGEFATISVWNAIGRRLTPLWQSYPHSLLSSATWFRVRCNERYLVDLVWLANSWTGSDNLVMAGSVVLANTRVAQRCGFRHLWIMPNPGDAGRSLGAALAYHGKHIS